MKKLILTALAALTVSAPAMADKWSYIGLLFNKGFVAYVNTSSIRTIKNSSQVWTTEVYFTNNPAWDYSLIKYRFNCTDETATMLAVFRYKDGQLIYRRDTPDETFYPAPRSYSDLIMKEACYRISKYDYIVEADSPEGLKEDARDIAKQYAEELEKKQ